jgi:hypothetical protein
MVKKNISLEQLKDALRYVFGDVYGKTDLTDYDNWCGFNYFIEDVWRNLDKRIAHRKKKQLRQKPVAPVKYKKVMRLPFVGDLFRVSKSL